MKTLITEDSGFYRKALSRYVRDWGLETVVTKSGAEAWSALSAPDGPRLALVDWVLQRLNYAASHDSLTGLCNRGEIENFLHRELLRGARDHQPNGVILADIDHCKRVNDKHGHAAGDQVLKKVARRLRAGLRAYDGVGRYGGEEFLIILPGCDAAQTFRRADELRHAICALPATGGVYVTISMGVCSSEDLGSDPDFLLKNADDALYRAKDLGRNRVHPATIFRPMAASSSVEMRSFL